MSWLHTSCCALGDCCSPALQDTRALCTAHHALHVQVRFADDMLKWLVKDYENWAHGRPRVTAVDIDTALTSDDFKRGLGSISEAADEGQRMVAAGPVRHDA